MLVSDGVYRRIPLFWITLGSLFLLLGFIGGADLAYFPAYMGIGALCVVRGVWVYQARWKVHKRNQLAITRETVVIRHPIAEDDGK